MTQEYTPVSWQDETTSQQGTLINAERMNQMQTAHHYADGLEEVDAVPTADPGVEYHKIVYCTADSTLYRWDGTQWTADIDDETKRLLLEHEADHSNPHQVTKAQVGLGNADNTSDLDKPVSTATQNALNAKADKATTYTKTETDTLLAEKADKATTLAGYGITDAYTKSQADSLLADKADKADTYDKTAVDGLLAGKVDKLISSPAGTYKSVTVNAQGQVTAGTNPTTLAGYGIADAYTKAEADTLLAAKADVATTYTKAEVDTLLGAKANDNAVVHLAGAETIPGAKTFTAAPTVLGNNDLAHLDIKSTRASGNLGAVLFKKSDGTTVASLYATIEGLVGVTLDGTTKALICPNQRAYDPLNVNDIATIKTLDQYAPMVRTSNAQTIGGAKTFTEIMKGSTFLMANKQIGGVTRVFAKASGYGIYRYGGAYLQVMCRDHLYMVRLYSGSTATIHNVTVIDMDSMQVVADKTTLPFTLGYYTENDEIFVTARGTSGNKLATISWLGGSQGGSAALALYPIEDAVVDPTAKGVIEFWTV